MLKNVFIEAVRKGLTGGNNTADSLGKYHPLLIEQYTEMAFNTHFFMIFKQDLSNYDRFCKTYKNIAVEYDSATDEYYCTLPIRVPQLPDVQEGVRRINPMKSISRKFIPLKKDSWEGWSELEAGKVDTSIGYCLDTTRVLWENNPGVDDVKMDIVRPFSEYEDTEDIPIPAGADVQIVDIVRKLMATTPNHDKQNDNIPNKLT